MLYAASHTPELDRQRAMYRAVRSRIDAAAKKSAPTAAPTIEKEPEALPKERSESKREYTPWFRMVGISKPSIKEIQIAVCDHYNITLTNMSSAQRTKGIVRPRQIAMYLAKKLTPHSVTMISRHFGGRDHTTVLHAVRKITHLIETDESLAAVIAEMTDQLGVDHATSNE